MFLQKLRFLRFLAVSGRKSAIRKAVLPTCGILERNNVVSPTAAGYGVCYVAFVCSRAVIGQVILVYMVVICAIDYVFLFDFCCPKDEKKSLLYRYLDRSSCGYVIHSYILYCNICGT